MKRTFLFIACCFLLFQANVSAGEYLQGEIVSSFADRLDLTAGDKLIVNVGKSLGVAKGDIAKITSRDAEDPLINTIGECAITDTNEGAAVCEIIKSKMEVHRGDIVFLRAMSHYTDAALYPLVLKTLHSTVNPYPPDKKLSVLVYHIFDEKNNVTALSEKIKREIVEVLGRKSRIRLSDGGSMMEAFYPSDDMYWMDDVKQFMRRANLDVLITGTYRMVDDQMTVSIYKVDLSGDDKKIVYSLPGQESYLQLASQVRIPYQKIERKEQFFCYFSLKPVAYAPMKDDKAALIRFEADGNPFIEFGMKRDDFNILSPVDVMLKIDNESFPLSTSKPRQLVTLTKGSHRIFISFRRGYYFNEILLHRSNSLIAREAVLDVTKSGNILVDISANPLPDKQPITIQVFDGVGKERQLLRPIRKLEADTVVETFKD